MKLFMMTGEYGNKYGDWEEVILRLDDKDIELTIIGGETEYYIWDSKRHPMYRRNKEYKEIKLTKLRYFIKKLFELGVRS